MHGCAPVFRARRSLAGPAPRRHGPGGAARGDGGEPRDPLLSLQPGGLGARSTTRSAATGAARTRRIGSWTSPSVRTSAARGRVRAPATWPSCATARSTSAESPPRAAGSQPVVSQRGGSSSLYSPSSPLKMRLPYMARVSDSGDAGCGRLQSDQRVLCLGKGRSARFGKNEHAEGEPRVVLPGMMHEIGTPHWTGRRTP